jgi:hypothetical protein
LRFAAALSSAYAVLCGQRPLGIFAVETSDPPWRFVLEVDESVSVHDGALPPDAPCLRGAAVALVEALSFRSPLPPSTPAPWLELVKDFATVFSPGGPHGA